jgi:hypothetical protein
MNGRGTLEYEPMSPPNVERLPDGWGWAQTGEDRIELDCDGGATLVGGQLGRGKVWRFIYRVERAESTFVDTLGEIADGSDPRSFLVEVARYIEDGDLPAADIGELLVIENGLVRSREWRIQ